MPQLHNRAVIPKSCSEHPNRNSVAIT